MKEYYRLLYYYETDPDHVEGLGDFETMEQVYERIAEVEAVHTKYGAPLPVEYEIKHILKH